jgi:biotin carboxyl carrier protein
VSEIGGRWSVLIGTPEGERHSGPSEGGADVESGSSRTARSYEVSFDSSGNGRYVVHVNGEAIPVTVLDPRAHVRRRGGAEGGQSDSDGPIRIVAPMPGRIVKVLVGPGDAVGARQGVVVVEAMKMENELRTPRAGTVTAVKVREGMSVEANAVLVIVT